MGTHSRSTSTKPAPSTAPTATHRSPGVANPGDAHLRAGSIAGLRSLRSGLGHYLGQRECRPETIADAQIVLAEIATNAFVHDATPLLDVQISCDQHEIVMSTWHRGDAIPPPHPVPPCRPGASPMELGGRGLAVVDRIVTSREVANAAGCTTTVVRMPR